MRKSIVTIALLMISTGAFAQLTTEDYFIHPRWEYYSNNFLNTKSAGKGYTGVASENDMSGAIVNPASISLNKKYQISVQYIYKTRQQQSPTTDPDTYLENVLPQGSVAFGMRLGKAFQTGILFSNTYSFKLSHVLILTDPLGNETGRTDIYETVTDYSFTVPLVYTPVKHLQIGANLNYSIYSFRNFWGDNNINNYKGSTVRVDLRAGIKWQSDFGLSVGASYLPGYSSYVNFKNDDGTALDETSRAYFPDRINAGVEYAFKTSPLKLSFEYEFSKTSQNRTLKDRHDIHFGAEYDVNKKLTARAGFFTLFDFRDLSNTIYNYSNDDYKQYFITAGCTYRIKKAEISLAVLDSHISPGLMKNTFVNAGVTLDF